WSNRGLHKPDFEPVPVEESAFDLVIEPGEIGTRFTVERAERPGRKVRTPPVTLLRDDEILGRDEARAALGLDPAARYALLSLGPGNLKDVSDIARGLTTELERRGFAVLWAQAPISVRDVPLPPGAAPLVAFPLVRYLRAFDLFAGAAGYNTCCEVLQSGVPSVLVPNTLLVDDQARRAAALAERSPAVIVSPCETPEERAEAVERLLALAARPRPLATERLDGAEHAAEEILGLIGA